jgi:hypothetical protein
MSERITQKMLERLVDRINQITGQPETSYTKDKDGRYRANVGNYHLDYAYGGVALEQMSTDGGGVHSVFGCGHVTKRELYNRLHAFINGLEAEKNS